MLEKKAVKVFVSLCEFLLALIDTGTVQLQQIPDLVMWSRSCSSPGHGADRETPPLQLH